MTKTRKECLIDLEFSEEDIKFLLVNNNFNEIKTRYLKLVKDYNLDNGLNKNRDKYQIVLQAFKLLKEYYKEDIVVINNNRIENSVVSIILESGGLFPGGVYAIDYLNKISCLIWSPHWRSDVFFDNGLGIIGLAYCTNITLLKYNILPILTNSVLIKENISSTISQMELEFILIDFGLNLISKTKSLE